MSLLEYIGTGISILFDIKQWSWSSQLKKILDKEKKKLSWKSETFNISPDSGELNYNLSNNSNIKLTVKWEHLSVCKRQFMYLRDKSKN